MPYPAWYTGDPTINAAITQAVAEQASGDGTKYVNAVRPINAQTGTAYTPVPSDVGKLVTLTNASAITLTLDKDADEAIPVGGEVAFIQLGAGLVTVAAESGATIHNDPNATSLAFKGQYGRVLATKIAANTWLLSGDMHNT